MLYFNCSPQHLRHPLKHQPADGSASVHQHPCCTLEWVFHPAATPNVSVKHTGPTRLNQLSAWWWMMENVWRTNRVSSGVYPFLRVCTEHLYFLVRTLEVLKGHRNKWAWGKNENEANKHPSEKGSTLSVLCGVLHLNRLDSLVVLSGH